MRLQLIVVVLATAPAFARADEETQASASGALEVYADSELMIRQLGGRYQVKSPTLKPLYDEAVRLLNDFSRVKLVHVPREMNKSADEMSNRAIDERMT